ncbi:MAG: hypothetical protein ACYDG4_13185 [Desulfuromonadaceae bacterium]
MAEDATGTVSTDTGKPASSDLNARGASDAGTGTADGQPGATEQTTQSSGTAAATGEEDTFFDPKDLDPALTPAYKQMQKAFTKKMEAIKKDRSKIEAYDSFSKDPVTQLQTMASRMGYKLTRAEAAAAVAEEGTTAANGDGEWQPKSWNEVFAKATDVIMEKLNPVLADVQATKKMNVEKLLDDSCPDWRQYEDEMTALLTDHPTLAKDPVKLYRLALPPEVLETRATQAALKKLQGKVDASKVSGTSTTKASEVQLPDKPVSFNEAVKAARESLAAQGMRAPR